MPTGAIGPSAVANKRPIRARSRAISVHHQSHIGGPAMSGAAGFVVTYFDAVFVMVLTVTVLVRTRELVLPSLSRLPGDRSPNLLMAFLL